MPTGQYNRKKSKFNKGIFNKNHKRGMIGKKHTLITKIKMRLNHSGGIKKSEKLTKEHKRKISKILKGRKNPKLSMLLKKLIGKLNYNWKGGKPKCVDCSKLLKNYNTKRCSACNYIFMSGENHHSWNNGVSFGKYPKKFNSRLKNKIRKRDNYICQLCGMTEKESKKIYNRKLSVNHIDFNKNNCKENNLNTLCCYCNSSVNNNQELFKNYFQNKIKGIINNENIEKLYSFKHYCALNKSQRFWQALRNWSGYAFIYGRKDVNESLEDTFYKD